MMNRWTLWLGIAGLTLAGSAVQAQACENASFERGDVVVVNPGEAQNVREGPTLTAELVQSVPAGEYLTVWDGPTCGEGYAWWQVEYDRQTGWTAEAPAEGGAAWLSKVEMQTLEAGGVHFDVSPSIGRDLTFTDQRFGGGDGFDVPAHRRFTLEGYPFVPEWSPYSWFWLGIPVTGGVMIAPRTPMTDRDLNLDALQTTLEQVQRLPADLMTYVQPVARYDHPQHAYLTIAGATGERWLSYPDPSGFDPSNFQPVRPDLIYYAQGLSADGNFYIRALFPLSVEITLPEFPPELLNIQDTNDAQETFEAYMLEVNTTFDALPPDSFTPRIALLDALMRSIEITEPFDLQPSEG